VMVSSATVRTEHVCCMYLYLYLYLCTVPGFARISLFLPIQAGGHCTSQIRVRIGKMEDINKYDTVFVGTHPRTGTVLL
jgi:hypothetical protein